MLLLSWPPLTRGLFVPNALTCHNLHCALLLQFGRVGGKGGGEGGGRFRVSELPTIFMQRESSPPSITPKRTARKRVKSDVTKSGVKFVSTFSTVDGQQPQQQQQNDSIRVSDATLAEDWHKFTKTEVPELVRSQMQTIKELELELGEDLIFGGPRGSLKGRPGAVEDHRHRAFYETLSHSEEKLQNFAARQVACRVLGSKGYACEDCWLPMVDCMCRAFESGTLYRGVCIWLYMHPKDFLRKNNTGKLLWQVFGYTAARVTVCGVQEQEEVMWKVFEQAGRDRVWCVFPEKSPPDYRVVDIPIPDQANSQAGASETLHFVLIDGTWSNSKSMVSRLKERATALWGEGGMPCVALSPTEVSVMHDLRPQPSTERTCTAAAAAQLLLELSRRSELAGAGLDRSSQLLEDALESLNNALISRRSRDGRTTSRAERVYLRSGRSPIR
ncbi:unnamed protein product [Calypogeia fissa]